MVKKIFITFLALTSLFCLVFSACSSEQSSGEVDDAPATYTVTIVVNNAKYGSIDKNNVINVAKDTKINVCDNRLTIGETVITATPASATVEVVYSFDKFEYSGTSITGDITITAVFTSTERTYAVKFMVGNEEFGLASSLSYGVRIKAPSKTPEKKADSKYEYVFDGWYDGETEWNFEEDIVESDTVLVARFRMTVTYTEEFLPSGN